MTPAQLEKVTELLNEVTPLEMVVTRGDAQVRLVCSGGVMITIAPRGSVYWRKHGKLHRVAAPAICMHDGVQGWFHNGIGVQKPGSAA